MQKQNNSLSELSLFIPLYFFLSWKRLVLFCMRLELIVIG